MTKLQRFHDERDALGRNRLVFDWLSDDEQRAEFYADLRAAHSGPLRLKSLLRSGGDTAGWPNQDLYLLSSAADIETALVHGSVAPYRELDSGGRFMLGLDDLDAHEAQNRAAAAALRFTPRQIEACAREAFDRAAVLPLKNRRFDLPTELAEQAALHFAALLFGLPVEAHRYLQEIMRGAYRRLCFQIFGRHFVSDAGLPAPGSTKVLQLKQALEDYVRDAKALDDPKDALNRARLVANGLPEDTVISRLYRDAGLPDAEAPMIVALGLMAGAIGNVRAAVAIVFDHLFAANGPNPPLIDQARRAARSNEPQELEALIAQALLRNPPAPFLTRTATGQHLRFESEDGNVGPIPTGAHLLLLMGAPQQSDLLFGGPRGQDFLHRCVGEHLARPLILEVVRRALLLPGLSQVIDPETERPVPLKKTWGVICDSYPLQFQRERLRIQQPLFVVLPIKAPVAENARKLRALTEAGAYVIEEALARSRHVHFAWFNLVENDTHLAMTTVFDGDFDAYVEHFGVTVPLFDEQFKLLDCDQPLPISEHPKAFVETIRKYNRAPLGGYFFSAYPKVSVADVHNTLGDGP